MIIKGITHSIVRKFFPLRDDKSHKNTFGKILICGGSYSMIGAPYFSSISALRSGCGILYMFVPALVKGIVSSMIPEAIIFASKGKNNFIYNDKDVFFELIERIKPDVVLFGPGMGVDNSTCRFLLSIIERINVAFVIDADGLNILSNSKKFDLLKGKTAILTPHRGEALRFFKIDDIKKLALKISIETQSIVILKDFNTIVTDGKEIYILQKPNSALSKAGSGDVLSGIVSGIWAQKGKSNGFNKRTALESSICGVYIHSICGDIAQKDRTKYGVISSDLIASIPYAIKRIL